MEATIHLEPETWHPDHDVLTANAGTPIHLAADSNGDIAAWEWSLAAQPSDAGPRLLANGATAVLHTPLTGEYRVVLDGTTADGTRLCQPAEVTLWVWDTEFERRFEVTWQGPGDLDIHLRRVGGDDAWFGADDCWEGQVGLFGQYECQALHTLGAAGHEVLGLRHFLTEAVEIAVHRGHDGQGGVTEAKVRFYVRLPLGHPALSILYFEGPVSLGEGDLWHVGRWVQGQPLIPWLDTQGEPLVIDYGPRPSPSREGR